jgi:hypothetical protein
VLNVRWTARSQGNQCMRESLCCSGAEGGESAQGLFF